MFLQKKVVVAIVCLLALTEWSGTAFADLIANGGFETGDWTGWTAVGGVFPYGAGNSVAVVSTDAYEGTYSADLTKQTYGRVSNPPAMWGYAFAVQDGTPTIIGQTYTFSFAAKKLQGDANSRLEVDWNVAGLAWGPPSTTGMLTVGTDWTVFTYTGVAASTGAYSNYVAFRPANTAYNPMSVPAQFNPIPDEYLVDAISVTLAPEPSALALLSIGLLGLLCYAWRKRG